MKFRDSKDEVLALLEEENTKTNKELLIAAACCTLIGLIVGFLFGKITTSRSTVKKFNKCYSYDFGEDEE